MRKSRRRWRAYDVAAVATSALFATGARAATRNWDGSVSQNWNVAGNWLQGAIPNAADQAFIQLDTADVGLIANAFAAELTVSDGAFLSTGGFTLSVATNITLIRNTASTVQLFVEPGAPVADVVTNTFNLVTGAELDMSGGVARMTLLDVDQDSLITGNGTIQLVGAAAANPLLNNRGNITVDTGTLTITSGVSTARIDLDGAGPGGGTGVITVSNGTSRLVLDAPLSDPFSATLVIGDGNEAVFNHPWENNNGVINLNGGTSLVTAARLSGTSYTHGGVLRVTNTAVIDAPIEFDDGSVTLNAAADLLVLEQATRYSGGTFTGPGQLRQNGNALVLTDTTISTGRYDWDGGGAGDTATTVFPAATLTLNVQSIESGANEIFNGTLNINSGSVFVNNATNAWTMAGSVNLRNSIGLPILSGDKLHATGNIRVTNTATIAAPTHLLGTTVTLASAADVLQFTNDVEFDGGGYTGDGVMSFTNDVSVLSDTTVATNLRFTVTSALSVPAGVLFTATRQTEWLGGTHGGAGTLANGGHFVVNGNTTLNPASLDWDGTGGTSTTTVNPGRTLTVNVGTVDLGINNQFDGTINVNGGRLSVANTANLWEVAGTINLASSGTNVGRLDGETAVLTGLLNATGVAEVNAPLRLGGGSVSVDAGGTLTLNGQLSSIGAQTLTKTGPGVLVVGAQAYAVNTNLHVNQGTATLTTDAGAPADFRLNLRVGAGTSAGAAHFQVSQHLRSLTIDNGKAALPGFAARVVTPALSIAVATGSQLDLTGGGMIVDYPGPASPAADIRMYLVSGYNGSLWNGPGIMSTFVQSNPARALGYGEASEILGLTGTNTASFLGETVDATAFLVRQTLLGDATLDQAVDFNDLVKLAQNYNTTVSLVTESWWARGDFTYDGVVDFSDLVKLAQHYNTFIPSAPIPGAPAGFSEDLARAFATVPEPHAVGLMMALPPLLARRRHSRTARDDARSPPS